MEAIWLLAGAGEPAGHVQKFRSSRLLSRQAGRTSKSQTHEARSAKNEVKESKILSAGLSTGRAQYFKHNQSTMKIHCAAVAVAVAIASASPFTSAFQPTLPHSSFRHHPRSVSSTSTPTNIATRPFFANHVDIRRRPIRSKIFIASSDAQQLHAGGPLAAAVNINEAATREIQPFEEWSRNCGVGMCDGFALTTTDGGMDYSVMTNQNVPSGGPILYVPREMVLTSVAAEQEFRAGLTDAERQLSEEGLRERVSLFRLFVK